MRNKKKRSILILLVLVLTISIGFALLSTTLKINGNAFINKNTWDVHWENVANQTGVTPVSEATIDPNDNTNVTFEANLALPGEYYEFTVDAVNNGTIDAMLKQIDVTLNGTTIENISKYLDLTIKYADGTDYEENDLLPKGKYITYKIRLQYKDVSEEDFEAIPNEGDPFTVDVTTVYVQADDNAVDKGNTKSPAKLTASSYFILEPDDDMATTDVAGFYGSTPTADQTLWRVIDVHSDGTIDAIAEYVSTVEISITGAPGFLNYVAGLQDIASHYAKDGYTVSTRMFGYDGQTSTISNTDIVGGTSYDIPSTTKTPTPKTGVGEEFDGGILGDTLYLKDFRLLNDVYGDGVLCKTKNNQTKRAWVASRCYDYSEGSPTYFGFGARTISNTTGVTVSCSKTISKIPSASHTTTSSITAGVLPIITLKSGIKIADGTGDIDNPYIFE